MKYKKTIVFVVFTALPVYATLLGYFPSYLQSLEQKVLATTGIANQDIQRGIILFATLLITYVFSFSIRLYYVVLIIINKCMLFRNLNGQGILNITSNYKQSGNRIIDFQSLREKATKSIIIMGVGMTKISSEDLYILEEQLNKGLTIRLLMLNPQVFEGLDAKHPNIGEDYLDRYFLRNGYSKEVKVSYDRLVSFINERKRLRVKRGKVELRTYNDFAPINLTAIDENEQGELIVEFCFPFSSYRIRIHAEKSKDNDLHAISIDCIENLWRNGNREVDDN